MPSTLDQTRLQDVLKREHGKARDQHQRWRAERDEATPPATRGWRDFRQADIYEHAYLSIGPAQGELLYMLARACQARVMVEFGSSFGVSTLYLAAAAKDNGGQVIGSEYYATKRDHALDNLRDAGLDHRVEIRQGDALETLTDLPVEIDLVFLDGDKRLYQPVLDLLLPRLRSGGWVIADNLDHFNGELGDFRHTILHHPDFTTRIMTIGRGCMSVSLYHPAPSTHRP